MAKASLTPDQLATMVAQAVAQALAAQSGGNVAPATTATAVATPAPPDTLLGVPVARGSNYADLYDIDNSERSHSRIDSNGKTENFKVYLRPETLQHLQEVLPPQLEVILRNPLSGESVTAGTLSVKRAKGGQGNLHYTGTIGATVNAGTDQQPCSVVMESAPLYLSARIFAKQRSQRGLS
jgi:hypothetical protein